MRKLSSQRLGNLPEVTQVEVVKLGSGAGRGAKGKKMGDICNSVNNKNKKKEVVRLDPPPGPSNLRHTLLNHPAAFYEGSENAPEGKAPKHYFNHLNYLFIILFMSECLLSCKPLAQCQYMSGIW